MLRGWHRSGGTVYWQIWKARLPTSSDAEASQRILYRLMPADMRMKYGSRKQPPQVSWRNGMKQLPDMFSKNAELRNARQLARAITMTRVQSPPTTGDLGWLRIVTAETVMFQAPRIAVNDETAQKRSSTRREVGGHKFWKTELRPDALRPHEDDNPANMTGQKKSTSASRPKAGGA